jgi:hypothetical protein
LISFNWTSPYKTGCDYTPCTGAREVAAPYDRMHVSPAKRLWQEEINDSKNTVIGWNKRKYGFSSSFVILWPNKQLISTKGGNYFIPSFCSIYFLLLNFFLSSLLVSPISFNFWSPMSRSYISLFSLSTEFVNITLSGPILIQYNGAYINKSIFFYQYLYNNPPPGNFIWWVVSLRHRFPFLLGRRYTRWSA